VATPEIYEQVNGFMDETPGLEKVLLIEGQDEDSMSGLERVGEAQPAAAVHPSPMTSPR
jgi:hypothetical protein